MQPALNNFLSLLYKSKTDKQGVINIVHIGDSHIQADYFSGMLRMCLQKQFGNAGRGLIFPYKVAKTNEPYNYLTTTDAHMGKQPLCYGPAAFTDRVYAA